MFDKIVRKLRNRPHEREDDVADDGQLAQSRDTGGRRSDGGGDASSTTGTGVSESYVGRVAGQDEGSDRTSGAEARAFGADNESDSEIDREGDPR